MFKVVRTVMAFVLIIFIGGMFSACNGRAVGAITAPECDVEHRAPSCDNDDKYCDDDYYICDKENNNDDDQKNPDNKCCGNNCKETPPDCCDDCDKDDKDPDCDLDCDYDGKDKLPPDGNPVDNCNKCDQGTHRDNPRIGSLLPLLAGGTVEVEAGYTRFYWEQDMPTAFLLYNSRNGDAMNIFSSRLDGYVCVRYGHLYKIELGVGEYIELRRVAKAGITISFANVDDNGGGKCDDNKGNDAKCDDCDCDTDKNDNKCDNDKCDDDGKCDDDYNYTPTVPPTDPDGTRANPWVGSMVDLFADGTMHVGAGYTRFAWADYMPAAFFLFDSGRPGEVALTIFSSRFGEVQPVDFGFFYEITLTDGDYIVIYVSDAGGMWIGSF